MASSGIIFCISPLVLCPEIYAVILKFPRGLLTGVCVCSCFGGPRRQRAVGNMETMPSQVADVVRPKLLLEVKAANKAGSATERPFTEDGRRSCWWRK
jgi:hypothetical protein